MSTNSALEQVIIDDLASSSGNQGVDSTAVSGTRAGSIVEQNAAIQVNFKIGRHYRGGKPKCYLPFGVQGDTAGTQLWSNAFATAVNTGWNAFIAALNGHTSGGFTGGAQVAVSYFKGPTANPNRSPWSRKNVPAARATPVVDTVISIAAARTIVNLRRRQGRP